MSNKQNTSYDRGFKRKKKNMIEGFDSSVPSSVVCVYACVRPCMRVCKKMTYSSEVLIHLETLQGFCKEKQA